MRDIKVVNKVFVGCCSSSFLMEIMMSIAPESANMITCLQFLFIALQSLISLKFEVLHPKVPIKQYLLLVVLFFVTSVANNYVYALHVPSTLHMIIRSASSPASMLVSWYVKKQRPRTNAVIGSVIITIGVILATYGGSTVVVENKGTFIQWCLGVAILLVMLIVGALTGLQQEILFTKYGKNPQEMMFYSNALPLPLFLGIYPQLEQVASNLPQHFWFLVVVNILSQFYCTHSVHELATKESSTTVNFILTLRKFLSLLISSIVFKNNLTVLHVVGSVFVIVGTYFYFDFFMPRQQRSVEFKNKKYSDYTFFC